VIFPSGFVPEKVDVEAYEVSTDYDYKLSGSRANADGFYYLSIPLGVFIVVDLKYDTETNGGYGRDWVEHFVSTLTLTADKNLDIVVTFPGTIVNISGYDISINYTILIQLINNYMT
jgi:hypothetical protein